MNHSEGRTGEYGEQCRQITQKVVREFSGLLAVVCIWTFLYALLVQ